MPTIRPLVAAVLISATAATATAASAEPRPPAQTRATAQSFTAPVAAWPDSQWWRGYGDQQLEDLIEAGLRDSPSLAVAEARLKRATALVGSARAPSLPSLTLGASRMHVEPSDDSGLALSPRLRDGAGVTGAGALAGLQLDLWGRYRNAAQAARSDRGAAQADVAAARILLSTEIAYAYGEFAAHCARRDVMEAAQRVRAETLAAARRRFDTGVDNRGDLALAQAAAAQANADLAAEDEAVALVRIRLAALIGAGPDRGLAITRPAPATLHPAGLPADLPAQLLERRPDIVAARRRADAAGYRVREARAAFLPNVNLLALAGSQVIGGGALFAAGTDLSAAGGRVTLPILDGGRRRAHLAVSRADQAAAAATYEDAVTHALAEVASTVASQQALGRRLAEGRVALAASREAWEASQRRYKAGDVGYPAVLLAEDRMLAEQARVVSLEAHGFGLEVVLIRALGGGWQASD